VDAGTSARKSERGSEKEEEKVHARDAAAKGDPEVGPEKAGGKPRHPEDGDATKQRRKWEKIARYAALPDAARAYPRCRPRPSPTPPASITDAARICPRTSPPGRVPGHRHQAAHPDAAASPRSRLRVPTPPPSRSLRRRRDRETARRFLSRGCRNPGPTRARAPTQSATRGPRLSPSPPVRGAPPPEQPDTLKRPPTRVPL
jgi:hypothetical protein